MIANEVYETRAIKAEAEKEPLAKKHLEQIAKMNEQIELANAQICSLTN